MCKINNYVSRYVIPFYFDYENDGYDKLVNFFLDKEKGYKEKYKAIELGLPKDCEWVKCGFWENYKSSKPSQSEMDIYSYLLSTLNGDDKCDQGSSFVLKTQGSILKLKYINSKNNEEYKFECKDLGTLIFKNGVGFIWYDVDFGKIISLEDYVDFQHDFKELSRSNRKVFKRLTVHRNQNAEFRNDDWIDFSMGKWIVNLFDLSIYGIKFWAERKTELDDTHAKISIPDKALLFQYMFTSTADEKNRMDLAFYVANGYNRSYNTPFNLKNEICEPFGNVSLYISKSGFAYIASDNDSNKNFFNDNFTKKFITDYFFIYVLLLYQTYSSAHYSRLLSKLPAEMDVIESNEKNLELLESLHSQINLFLVKSTYGSVSNIQHQNSVYIYGKSALSIEEDFRSLTIGLDALRGIEVERQRKAIEKKEKEEDELKEKKDRALSIGVAVFGLLTAFSAALESLNLVDWLAGNTLNPGHFIALGIVSLLTIIMVIVLIINIHRKK